MTSHIALRYARLVRFSVVVLAAALLAAGCEDPSIRFNQMGQESYRAGDYTRARAAFEEAIQRNPDVGEYYFNRGVTEQALGNFDFAIFNYDMATHLSPGIVPAYRNAAQCHLEKDQPDRALAVLETGTRANPYTAEAFINVAQFYLSRQNLSAAKLWLAKAVAADPDNPVAHREYATILIRTGERDKGIEHLRMSLERAPVQPEVSATLSELAPPGDQLPPPKPQTE